MFELVMDVVLDALIDSAKLIPFLFIIYILLEYIDRKSGTTVYSAISKAKKLGPLFGGIIGAVPQCGLSAAAATLYSNKVISVGVLLAVFLSASDDMVPIFITEAVPVIKLIKVLFCKMIIGVVTGYLVDIFIRLVKKKEEAPKPTVRMMSRKQVASADTVQICTASCCRGNFWLAVTKHTLQVFGFVFVVSIILGIVIGAVGEDVIGRMLGSTPVLGQFAASLIGLIPNCASSIIITQLYLSGTLNTGSFIAGLLVNAGVGILTLLRSNKNKKDSIKIIAALYFIGVFWGIIIELLHITF